MPENWKTYELGGIATLRKQNITPKAFVDQPYIGLEHIGQGNFLLEGIGKATDATSNKSVFLAGDILYGKIRPYFKKAYRPKFDGICSTDILVIKSKKSNLVIQEYLYHIVKNQEFTDKAIETSTGTKMPRADWNSLGNYVFSIPPLPEQIAIASILSAIDDKIENNLQMNKTLEEMAMTLYKHWFLDFGPFRDGEFVDSELGRIPKGWEVKSTEDVFSVKDGTHDSPKQKNQGHFLITSKHIKKNEIDLSSAYKISSEDFLKVNQRSRVDNGDILMTMIGTVGIFYLVNEEPNYAIKNIGLFKTSEVPELKYYLFLFFNSAYSSQYINSQLAGSTQQYLTLKVLRSFHFLYPTSDVLTHFAAFISKTKKKQPKFKYFHLKRRCFTGCIYASN